MDATILPVIHAANKLFLSGIFGSGKTTLALERIRWLLAQERVRGDDILVLAPQRTLGRPYQEALRSGEVRPGALPHVTTLASLVRNAVELYWPLLASEAAFADPAREPTFLTLETSQYHMAPLVDGAIAQGDFDSVRVQRSRVISQVLDNLNKAALNRFTIDQAYQRLELAVPPGEQQTGRLNALRAARRISQAFREHCYRYSLLDFSLQVHLFNTQVLKQEWSRTHLLRSYRHLVVENAEEDTATAHNLVRLWLERVESALILSDRDGGYRLYLGADPAGVEKLADACDLALDLDKSRVMPDYLDALTWRIDRAVLGVQAAATTERTPPPTPALERSTEGLVIPERELRFYPQMIDWAVEEIARLVQEEGVEPAGIAVLAPFVSDALRFSLERGLRECGIPLTTHRPSRALEDEPAARSLLTLAALAHPGWGILPPPADVADTLGLCIQSLDPVRAHLLTQIVYPPRRRTAELGRFGDLVPAMQQRITYVVGEEYDRLREWIYAYRAQTELTPLDQFIARLFGELLSQPGYGFHMDANAARVANQLVESARKFRWSLEESMAGEDRVRTVLNLGREYLALVESGALGALYVPGWREADDAVFLAPAYTFLMRNRAVDVQFWLDIGSGGWWERLYQPLTHPHVLAPEWNPQELWTDLHEYSTRQETLRRLLNGLVRRTRRRIYVGMSNYSESGFEQSGPLLSLINRLLVEAQSWS